MNNEEFQKLVLEKFDEINLRVDKIEKHNQNIIINLKNALIYKLEERRLEIEEFQRILSENLEGLGKIKTMLNENKQMLNKELTKGKRLKKTKQIINQRKLVLHNKLYI